MQKKIREDQLCIIAYNYDLDHFIGKNQFNESEFMINMYLDFEKVRFSIERKSFNLKDFLNILLKQYHFVIENINSPYKCVTELKKLPFSFNQQYVFYAKLLKMFWFYPPKGIPIHFRTIQLIYFELASLYKKRRFWKSIFLPDQWINNLDLYGYEKLFEETRVIYYEIQEKESAIGISNFNTGSITEKGFDQTTSFALYLLHPRSEILALALKNNFTTERSKRIRFILEALESFNPPLINIIDGQKKHMYEALKQLFGRDIGSYNSIFQCKFVLNNPFDKSDTENLEKYKSRITSILVDLDSK